MATLHFAINSQHVKYPTTTTEIPVGGVEVYIMPISVNRQDLVDNAKVSHKTLKSFLETNCLTHGPNTTSSSNNVAYDGYVSSAPATIYYVLLSDLPSNPIQAYYISGDVPKGVLTLYSDSLSPNFSLAPLSIDSDYTGNHWYSFVEDKYDTYFNGNQLEHIYFNGTEIEHLSFNGNQII